MVGSFKYVLKAEFDESQRSLAPPRIEPDQAGISHKFEGSHGAPGWQKAENRHHAYAEPRQARLDGKLRLFCPDRILEQHVEHSLVPVQFRFVRQGAGP